MKINTKELKEMKIREDTLKIFRHITTITTTTTKIFPKLLSHFCWIRLPPRHLTLSSFLL